MNGQWNHKIFSVTEAGFDDLALEIFRFQYENNPVYNAYAKALGVNAVKVNTISQIPFLPISFFKTHNVVTTVFEPQTVFESSGTTGATTSRHLIKDLSIYEESFLRGFELFYGPIADWCTIGLLPSYLERENSSLVYMVNKMISLSNHPESGFYLNEYDLLKEILIKKENQKQKTLLIGVTFALLDFAENYSFPLAHTTIMETGGMKGRRKEMIREEVHAVLEKSFGVASVHSEYGMTELLSQAYSKGNGSFKCPAWMNIMVRDEDDPLYLQNISLLKDQSHFGGAFNVIDLANVYSCSFIATDDIGKLYKDGSFEVQGRMDASDIRGCNLLIA